MIIPTKSQNMMFAIKMVRDLDPNKRTRNPSDPFLSCVPTLSRTKKDNVLLSILGIYFISLLNGEALRTVTNKILLTDIGTIFKMIKKPRSSPKIKHTNRAVCVSDILPYAIFDSMCLEGMQ